MINNAHLGQLHTRSFRQHEEPHLETKTPNQRWVNCGPGTGYSQSSFLIRPIELEKIRFNDYFTKFHWINFSLLQVFLKGDFGILHVLYHQFFCIKLIDTPGDFWDGGESSASLSFHLKRQQKLILKTVAPLGRTVQKNVSTSLRLLLSITSREIYRRAERANCCWILPASGQKSNCNMTFQQV